MQGKPRLSAVLLLIGLLVFQGLAPDLQAQALPPPPTPQQLDQLLAPIALYPDSLLAQITTASTNPQEILDVQKWLGQNSNLTVSQLTAAAQQQGFDPAFIALAGFPQVIEMMAEHIDDYAAIGSAVTANQAEVSASIQRLRAQAYASGALRTSPQQVVDVQQNSGQPIYVIQPANPQVVYLPQYNPTVVYTGSSGAGLITFGIAIGITALLVSQPWGWGGWGWNWGGRRIYYNRGPWGGWGGGYHPPHYYYRPRPVPYNSRPGYGGNWGYRPPNYRPPQPVNRPGTRPPGYNRPVNGYRPPPNNNRPPTNTRPPNNNRPPTNTRPPNNNRPPNNGRPTTQPVRPGTPNRPVSGPGNQRPPNNNKPATQPSRPGTPNNRPQTKPAPQQRPTSSSRPAPRPQTRPAQPQKQGGNNQRGPR
jgi:Protein of unknown function (DUF3300)